MPEGLIINKWNYDKLTRYYNLHFQTTKWDGNLVVSVHVPQQLCSFSKVRNLCNLFVLKNNNLNFSPYISETSDGNVFDIIMDIKLIMSLITFWNNLSYTTNQFMELNSPDVSNYPLSISRYQLKIANLKVKKGDLITSNYDQLCTLNFIEIMKRVTEIESNVETFHLYVSKQDRDYYRTVLDKELASSKSGTYIASNSRGIDPGIVINAMCSQLIQTFPTDSEWESYYCHLERGERSFEEQSHISSVIDFICWIVTDVQKIVST